MRILCFPAATDKAAFDDLVSRLAWYLRAAGPAVEEIVVPRLTPILELAWVEAPDGFDERVYGAIRALDGRLVARSAASQEALRQEIAGAAFLESEDIVVRWRADADAEPLDEAAVRTLAAAGRLFDVDPRTAADEPAAWLRLARRVAPGPADPAPGTPVERARRHFLQAVRKRRAVVLARAPEAPVLDGLAREGVDAVLAGAAAARADLLERLDPPALAVTDPVPFASPSAAGAFLRDRLLAALDGDPRRALIVPSADFDLLASMLPRVFDGRILPAAANGSTNGTAGAIALLSAHYREVAVLGTTEDDPAPLFAAETVGAPADVAGSLSAVHPAAAAARDGARPSVPAEDARTLERVLARAHWSGRSAISLAPSVLAPIDRRYGGLERTSLAFLGSGPVGAGEAADALARLAAAARGRGCPARLQRLAPENDTAAAAAVLAGREPANRQTATAIRDALLALARTERAGDDAWRLLVLETPVATLAGLLADVTARTERTIGILRLSARGDGEAPPALPLTQDALARCRSAGTEGRLYLAGHGPEAEAAAAEIGIPTIPPPEADDGTPEDAAERLLSAILSAADATAVAAARRAGRAVAPRRAPPLDPKELPDDAVPAGIEAMTADLPGDLAAKRLETPLPPREELARLATALDLVEGDRAERRAADLRALLARLDATDAVVVVAPEARLLPGDVTALRRHRTIAVDRTVLDAPGAALVPDVVVLADEPAVRAAVEARRDGPMPTVLVPAAFATMLPEAVAFDYRRKGDEIFSDDPARVVRAGRTPLLPALQIAGAVGARRCLVVLPRTTERGRGHDGHAADLAADVEVARHAFARRGDGPALLVATADPDAAASPIAAALAADGAPGPSDRDTATADAPRRGGGVGSRLAGIVRGRRGEPRGTQPEAGPQAPAPAARLPDGASGSAEVAPAGPAETGDETAMTTKETGGMAREDPSDPRKPATAQEAAEASATAPLSGEAAAPAADDTVSGAEASTRTTGAPTAPAAPPRAPAGRSVGALVVAVLAALMLAAAAFLIDVAPLDFWLLVAGGIVLLVGIVVFLASGPWRRSRIEAWMDERIAAERRVTDEEIADSERRLRREVSVELGAARASLSQLGADVEAVKGGLSARAPVERVEAVEGRLASVEERDDAARSRLQAAEGRIGELAESTARDSQAVQKRMGEIEAAIRGEISDAVARTARLESADAERREVIDGVSARLDGVARRVEEGLDTELPALADRLERLAREARADLAARLDTVERERLPALDDKVGRLAEADVAGLAQKVERLASRDVAAIGNRLKQLVGQEMPAVTARLDAIESADPAALAARVERLAGEEVPALSARLEAVANAEIPALSERVRSVAGEEIAALSARIDRLDREGLPEATSRAEETARSAAREAAAETTRPLAEEVERLRDVELPRLWDGVGRLREDEVSPLAERVERLVGEELANRAGGGADRDAIAERLERLESAERRNRDAAGAAAEAVAEVRRTLSQEIDSLRARIDRAAPSPEPAEEDTDARLRKALAALEAVGARVDSLEREIGRFADEEKLATARRMADRYQALATSVAALARRIEQLHAGHANTVARLDVLAGRRGHDPRLPRGYHDEDDRPIR